jgi:hypothetical protein
MRRGDMPPGSADDRHRVRVEKVVRAFWAEYGPVQIPNDILVALLDSDRPEALLERFAGDLAAAMNPPCDAPSTASIRSGDAARYPDPPVRGRSRSAI